MITPFRRHFRYFSMPPPDTGRRLAFASWLYAIAITPAISMSFIADNSRFSAIASFSIAIISFHIPPGLATPDYTPTLIDFSLHCFTPAFDATLIDAFHFSRLSQILISQPRLSLPESPLPI
jgi:hypothetical protein